MKAYTAIQGETWDQIAVKLYRRETAMNSLIAANPQHRYTLFFMGGVVLKVPDVAPLREYAPPRWKRLG